MSNYQVLSNNPITDGISDACSDRLLVPAANRRALTGILRTWMARSRQRHQLANMPPHLLKDIGINAFDAASEAAKPFWVK